MKDPGGRAAMQLLRDYLKETWLADDTYDVADLFVVPSVRSKRPYHQDAFTGAFVLTRVREASRTRS